MTARKQAPRNGAPLTDEEGEVRELTGRDMRGFRPASEILPAQLYADLLALNAGQRPARVTPSSSPPAAATPAEI